MMQRSFQSRPTESNILSVSAFNQQARRLLEVSFPNLWIEGEISNLVKHTSGHWYFSLKDEKSQIRCAMFKGQNRTTSFSPKDGMQVIVKASASLYPARGDFQLIVQHMEQAGDGALQRAFETLKQKLMQEGLFAPEIKQPLPTFPKHIGVISSPTGAVIQDICAVLKRRCPLIKITLLPASVQGKKAPEQLIHRLTQASTDFDFDALIIARGGGSLEDLQPFNEESVARAIASCPIPLVSSIGHETDTTIADFVADVRAPTPSAAAELLSPDQQEWRVHIKQKETLLFRMIMAKIQTLNSQVTHLQKRLRHPQDSLREQTQRLDYLTMRLQQALDNKIRNAQHESKQLQQRLLRHSPKTILNQALLVTHHLNLRLQQAIQKKLDTARHHLQIHCRQLNTLSPLQTLERGFSITKKENGEIITTYRNIQPGERVTVQLHEGKLDCTVNTCKKT